MKTARPAEPDQEGARALGVLAEAALRLASRSKGQPADQEPQERREADVRTRVAK